MFHWEGQALAFGQSNQQFACLVRAPDKISGFNQSINQSINQLFSVLVANRGPTDNQDMNSEI